MPRFRPIAPLTARWRPEDHEGFVHLDLRPEGDRIVADGVTIGDRAGARFAARFRVICREDWTTLGLLVETTDGRTVRVTSDGNGRWSDGGGARLPEFDGCHDVDLEGTPFTNTLPIRRLDLSPEKGAVELSMFYVPFDTFRPFVDRQRYRCVGDRHYRYEAVDGSFEADITVDEDGLVLEYPPLFRRIALPEAS